jgi:hypothetical protein
MALQAADLDPALLALLRAELPEQIGDDLVLRLADGRVFYIDGFFAPDEIGDDQPPLPDAIELSAEIALLLLGESDIDTAAGEDDAPTIPPDSAAFATFAPDAPPSPDGADAAEATDDSGDEEDDLVRSAREIDERARAIDDERDGVAGIAASPSPLSSSAIGTISLAAGSLGAPTWSGPFDVRYLFRVEQLVDPAFEGWFQNLSKAKPFADPLDLTTFLSRFDPALVAAGGITRADYENYVNLHNDVVAFADGRSFWASVDSYANSQVTRDNSIGTALPPGITPEIVFAGNDFIIGAGWTIDRLHGFGGDDILIGFAGENHLFGGDGNDLLISGLSLDPSEFSGGDGEDTLMLVLDNMRLIDASLLGPISSIERLILMPQSETSQTFLNDDLDSGRIILGDLVFAIDAATILAWGGTLTIDNDVADIRLTDIGAWTRLPPGNGDPAYVHYEAMVDGQKVTLAILASADQPIADAVLGTDGNDIFYLGGRVFQSFDGAGGTDQIQGGIQGGPIGSLDLQNAATVPFSNIESILLLDPSDQVILSADSIAAMTDARNTLWITGAGVGTGAEVSFQYHTGAAKGQVDLVDPAAWTALGYLSVETAGLPFKESRMGAIYGATIGTENVYIFVQMGLAQPIVANATSVDHWFVNHSGWVYLPPSGTVLDLAVIDLGNGMQNLLMLDVASAAALTGADGWVSLLGDAGQDTIQFADMADWQFSHVDSGFSIYLGDDGAGHQVELRVASNLVQPDLLPDTSGGDLEFLDLNNGHANLLVLDIDLARNLAGPDMQLRIYGDAPGDKVTFDDPQNWTLINRDGDVLVYVGDDGSGPIRIGIQATLDLPVLIPQATEGEDVLAVTRLQYVEDAGPIDGKGGFDTLRLVDAGDIFPDLDSFLNIEAIDLANGVDNRFFIYANTVVENLDAGPLLITGDSGDSVVLNPASLASSNYAWIDTGTEITHPDFAGKTFSVYQAQVPIGGIDHIVQVAIDQAMIQPDLV